MMCTTYFAKVRSLPTSVIPIAISNTVPDGFDIRHIPELAPSWDSITAFKKSGNREFFRTQYFRKLDYLGLDFLLDNLPRGDIAFVCYEKDPVHCHRSILAEWLKENCHLDVCEWGDKP